MDSISQQISLIIIASVFFIIVAIGIVILILVYQKRQLQYLNDKNQMRINFDKEIFETQLEIQEETLKNISQEIHDNIGQGLSLAKLHINTVDAKDDPVLQEKINTSRHLITKAIKDLRDLAKSLHTDYVSEMGLVSSVEYQLELIRKSGKYDIDFDVAGEPYKLDPKKELVIFRIVQEVLNNIIKHAKATLITVLITFKHDAISLEVSDNGKGFDAHKLEEKNYEGFGLGLRNMYNRAKLFKADFKLTSVLEKGTTVRLTLETGIEKTKI
jgi:two-component system NarL family sensor kinase